MTGIGKAFSGVTVLDDVDFELRAGETHALLGGNGAGKSTLMKILEGVYSLDRGTVELDGAPVELDSPQAARRHGIAMIFQEFSLVPTLTVAQNIYLTREARTRAGLLDDRALERRAGALLAELGVDIDPRAEVRGLTAAGMQLVEIAKALSQDARILIMDEPTASLAGQRGRGAVPDHRPAEAARHRDRLHHPPARGGDRRRRPGDGAARRARRRHEADERARRRGADRASSSAARAGGRSCRWRARSTAPAPRCSRCAA